jgi:hypothetical protein
MLNKHNTPDIFTFLSEEYTKYIQEESLKVLTAGSDLPVSKSFEGFIEFSKNYLTKSNPPGGVVYLATGMGVKLREGQVLSLGAQTESTEMRDEGVPITQPQSIPGQHGVVPTQSVRI